MQKQQETAVGGSRHASQTFSEEQNTAPPSRRVVPCVWYSLRADQVEWPTLRQKYVGASKRPAALWGQIEIAGTTSVALEVRFYRVAVVYLAV